MTRTTDQQLLREFTGRRDESAFAALVERYLPLVHSTARRQVGDAVLADDVSQQVFLLLALKAGQMPAGTVLSGWLYQTTRHVALHCVRSEQRRRTRELHAVAQMNQETSDSVWRAIEHDLDAAMGSLAEVDRNAILMRYFENRSLREVGEVLGFTDDAIQKRLSRAVEKLRVYFQGRGKVMGAESLSAAMAHFAVSPMPASTAAGISAAILQSSSVLTSTITLTTMKSFVLSSYLKPALLGVAGLTAAVAWLGEHRKVSTERARAQGLEARIVELELAAATPTVPASSPAVARLAEAERLELARLRGEVKRLRHQLERSKSAAEVSPRLNQPAAVAGDIQPTSTVLDPKRHQEQIEVLKHVGLGLRILGTSVESDPKSSSLQFGESGSLPKPFLDLVAPVEASLDQIEILVPDVPSMLKAEAMPQAIVARARQALPTPDGQFIRTYSLGDGSVQSIRHATADEAFGWGQDVGGNPIQWEVGEAKEEFDAARVKMDPELARRYGLSVGGK